MITVRSTINVASLPIPNGATAEYHIRQPSESVSSGNATIDDNKVLVHLTSDDTDEVGDNGANI